MKVTRDKEVQMVIQNLSEDVKSMAASTAVTLQRLTINVDTTNAVDTLFPKDLHRLIFEYLIDERNEKQFKYTYQRALTFVGNISALYTAYATQISFYLVWNIEVDKTLEFAKTNQECLTIKVEIKDPHGQRLKATPLVALQMAGDRNPRELKKDEKDYGLVERARPCFSTIPDEYDRQLAEWSRDSKEASRITMAPFVTAIKILCQQIIDSKEITNPYHFKNYLDLPMAQQFREALKPNPNHIVTAGFLFDVQIFLDFIEIFKMNISNDNVKDKKGPNLGEWDSLKSALFDAIVYPALQARVQRCDLPHFIKGVGYNEEKEIPKRIDFSNGVPKCLVNPGEFSKPLVGLGWNFFYNFWGLDRPNEQMYNDQVWFYGGIRTLKNSSWREWFSKFVSSKSPHAPSKCVIM